MRLNLPPPTHFWCDTCKGWTRRATPVDATTPAWCSACSENYTCGECGADINGYGECLGTVVGHAEKG